MSKFDRITMFTLVVEENGFAAAARKQGISTAAVSRQVTALEKEIGAQLLRRTTRHVALTEIGKDYYHQCKKTLDELQEAELAISKSKKEATGVLRIMANRYFATNYILPQLASFLRQNPKLQISFQLEESFPNLEKEEIDILFGVSLEGPNNLVRRRFSTTRYVLCASPIYFKKYGTPSSPADLFKHRYITHLARKPDDVILFKQGMEAQITPTIWLNDSYAMRECALEGMGIVNLHDYIVEDAIKAGQLIEILREYQDPQKDIYLYYQPNRYLQPKIRRFIDFYIAKLSR